MKERPIIFSGPMVKALLAGRKSQTRRVVNPQPIDVQLLEDGRPFGWFDILGHVGKPLTNRYGWPGDRLWVRESWAPAYSGSGGTHGALYKADHLAWLNGNAEWRPSIHMPRWASRITLEVTDVRVERLKDMKLADVESEGVDGPNHADGETWEDAIERYAALWDALNAKRGYPWSSNPFCWVLSFKKVTS